MKKIFMLFLFLNLQAINLPIKFSAEFNQTIINKDKKLIYKGKIFYKNPQIVWEYDHPEKKIIWIKDKVYIYEPDLEQVTITNKKDFSLDKILKNSNQISKNLYVSLINNKKIYFIYDKTLKKIYYTDKFGNKTEIIFFNQKNDVNTSKFNINFPKDVDVIYQSE